MKEAYYFPHDANARTDAKILELRAEFGWEGYGLWWALVEQLREASEYRLSNTLIGGLAMGLAIDKAKLRTLLDLCISVGLLVVEGECFYSPSLRRRMVALDNKRLARVESARNAAEKRWQSAGNANAMRTHSEGNADAMRIDATLEESTVDLTKPNLTKEEEPLPSVEDAASAAAPVLVESSEEEFTPLPESPATELRTPGGAGDVGTSVLKASRGGKKLRVDPAKLAYPGELEDVAFVAVFADFVKYRADKGKPMSAGGAEVLLKKLAAYPVEFAAELVLNAQANDYQGVVFDNTPEKYQRWQAARTTQTKATPQQHAVTRPSHSHNAAGAAAARLQTPTPDATSANPWGLPAYTPPNPAAITG